MKRKYVYPAVVLALVLLVGVAAFAWARPGKAAQEGKPEAVSLVPTGTGFTYQGELLDGGTFATGPYDFQFQLFDAAAGGTQVGSTVTLDDVPIFNGLFTVRLDFGAGAFGGGARWLAIAVRPGASGGAYTTLTPRQELAPAPYALAMPNVYTNEAINFVGIGRDFRISSNEVFGVRYEGSANDYGGMYVETANAGGWPFYGYATDGSFRAWTYYNGTNSSWHLYSGGIRLTVPQGGGLRIGPSVDYSLVISNTTGSDGVRIYDTGDDGIQVGSDPDYPNYGLYIPSPGVSAYGLWPNTAAAAGEWALFTVDKVSASNVTLQSISLVAQVTGPTPLTPGDVVAAAGMAEALPGAHSPLPLVRLADSAGASGVVGVVESRMVWEVAPGKEAEGEMSLHSVPGPAEAGDYVSLVVLGVTEVKVAPGSSITAGERLTAAAPAGRARSLQSRELEGMIVTEGAPVIGIALADSDGNRSTIPVLVTLR